MYLTRLWYLCTLLVTKRRKRWNTLFKVNLFDLIGRHLICDSRGECLLCCRYPDLTFIRQIFIPSMYLVLCIKCRTHGTFCWVEVSVKQIALHFLLLLPLPTEIYIAMHTYRSSLLAMKEVSVRDFFIVCPVAKWFLTISSN